MQFIKNVFIFSIFFCIGISFSSVGHAQQVDIMQQEENSMQTGQFEEPTVEISQTQQNTLQSQPGTQPKTEPQLQPQTEPQVQPQTDPQTQQPTSQTTQYNAVIIKIEEEKVISETRTYQKLNVQLDTPEKQVVTIENGLIEGVKNNIYKEKDKVKVTATIIGTNQNTETQYFISDYDRTDSIYILFALFIFLSILIAGKMAIRSLFAMFITFVVIFGLVLPQISEGANSFLIIMLFSLISIPVNFYLSHGINYKTTSAIIGTFVSLLITVILATLFVNYAHLTGYTTDESMFLQIAKGTEFNIKGLLLAGIIIGIVGVLDDITVSQASIVYQLKDANNKLNFIELFNRSMEVGKDHISSLINTLVLVYAGASLPLLLLFIDSTNTFYEVLNYEIIASEIIRTLIGSIGLVIAVPITTVVTSVFAEIFDN